MEKTISIKTSKSVHNLHKLYADCVNLKLGNRYNWLIDNMVAAIEATLKDPPPRKEVLELTKAYNLLVLHRDLIREDKERPEMGHEDFLGNPVVSAKTKQEIIKRRSPVSALWNVFTTIQPEGFADAVRESRAAEPR